MKLKVFEIMFFMIERNNKYCSQIFFLIITVIGTGIQIIAKKRRAIFEEFPLITNLNPWLRVTHLINN